MPEQPEPQDPKIIVDEDWKEQVQREKEQAAAAENAEATDETAQSPEQPDASGEASSDAAPSADAGIADDEEAAGAMPPLPAASFEFLVSMIATQALDAMGQIPRPDGSTSKPQKPLAKHYIDLLRVIEEKTNGNLTPEESKMLGEIQHQLRMAFLQS